MSGKTMTAILAGLTLFCLFMALLAGGAIAQSACGPVTAMIEAITGPKYREIPFFDAIVKTPLGPRAIRMFANQSTGTWTILTLQQNGTACIAGAGGGFSPARKTGRDA